jgi:hypothetical protein
MTEVKVGDRVKVYDGSYSLGVTSKLVKHQSGLYLQQMPLEVLAIDVQVPSTPQSKRDNDTILRNLDTGEIIFIRASLMDVIPQPCKCCCKCCNTTCCTNKGEYNA